MTWLGMLGAALGMAIMMGGDVGSGAMAGNLPAFASAVGFAVFTVSLRASAPGGSRPGVLLGGVFSLLAAGGMMMLEGSTPAIPAREAGFAPLNGMLLGSGTALFAVGSRGGTRASHHVRRSACAGPGAVGHRRPDDDRDGSRGLVLFMAIAGNALRTMRRIPDPARG